MQTWLKSFYRTAPATLIITSACIILWLVAAFQARSLTNVFSNSELVHAMMVWGPAFEVADHWWTPLSYAFMHLDIGHLDRKSTRLNSSHVAISYAVFCFKKKNTIIKRCCTID